jgi:hypothetical protein
MLLAFPFVKRVLFLDMIHGVAWVYSHADHFGGVYIENLKYSFPNLRRDVNTK